MIEKGLVSKIDNKNRATVRFPRKTDCENCKMCLKPKDEPYVEIVIDNRLNAAIGDEVEVSLGARTVLTASAVAYLVPVILVAIALAFTYKLNEIISFSVAIVALIVAEIGIVFIDKALRKKTDYMPKMVAIIKNNEGESDNGKHIISDDEQL